MRARLVTLLLPLLACDAAGISVSAPAPADAEALNYIERLTGGSESGEALPMVLVLHGRGDRPASFTKRLEGFDTKARFIYLEAPIDEGKGRGWFTFERGPGGWKRTSDEVVRLGERVVITLNALERRYATIGKPVLTGFSQGSMVIFAAIFAHPERFSFALPVSGALFDSIIPPNIAEIAPRLPPVVAFHGDDDPIIPARASEKAVALLRSHGARAEVRTFPEIPHWIMGSMKSDLLEELKRCLATTVAAVAQ